MKKPSAILVYQHFDTSNRLELVTEFIDSDQFQRLTPDEARQITYYRGQLVCMEYTLAKRIELAGGMPTGQELKDAVSIGLNEQTKTIQALLSKMTVE